MRHFSIACVSDSFEAVSASSARSACRVWVTACQYSRPMASSATSAAPVAIIQPIGRAGGGGSAAAAAASSSSDSFGRSSWTIRCAWESKLETMKRRSSMLCSFSIASTIARTRESEGAAGADSGAVSATVPSPFMASSADGW